MGRPVSDQRLELTVAKLNRQFAAGLLSPHTHARLMDEAYMEYELREERRSQIRQPQIIDVAFRVKESSHAPRYPALHDPGPSSPGDAPDPGDDP